MKEDNFFSDIEKYIDEWDTQEEIQISKKNRIKLINSIKSTTNLDNLAADIILKMFFETIKNSILNGDVIILRQFGNILISSPKNSTKKKIFLKFKPLKSMLIKLNANRT